MDDLKIYLPCAFKTTYKQLIESDKSSKCSICHSHKININECLEIPRNKLNIKQRQIELELENFEQMRSGIEQVKEKNVEFINSDFDRLKNEIDLMREKLKKSIDDYYFKILDELEAKRRNKIKENEEDLKEIESFKIESPSGSDDYLFKIDTHEINLSLLKDKINLYEERAQFSEKKIIYNLKKAKTIFNLEDIFGVIDLFDENFNKSINFCEPVESLISSDVSDFGSSSNYFKINHLTNSGYNKKALKTKSKKLKKKQF
ncbi:unnamed protein product [Brachionus calyciflorus]|uniref:Uncharacterized protein n=1 Tax=Brachionus calyciflorus TaxID=104777 RepID=A0A813X8Z7_9BILA|nr:unnamed protein product [Brachionus calyciflorus]